MAGSSLEISKSDGSILIVVWDEAPIWNTATNTAISPSPERVTLHFSYSYKVSDPLIGLRAIAAGYGSSISVNIVGSPTLIRLMPRH